MPPVNHTAAAAPAENQMSGFGFQERLRPLGIEFGRSGYFVRMPSNPLDEAGRVLRGLRDRLREGAGPAAQWLAARLDRLVASCLPTVRGSGRSRSCKPSS